MPDTNIRWAVLVVHAFAAWLLGVYAWDWWRNRRRKREGMSVDSSECDHVAAAAEADESTPPAVAGEE